MRPVPAAPRLRKPVLRRLGHVSAILQDVRRASSNDRDERRVAYAIIELQNTWAEFSQALFLTYALRGVAPSGVRVTHNLVGVIDKQAAISTASSQFNGRRPPWHEPATLRRLSQHFGFSNHADIVAGLSVQTRLFQDLPPVRNFYAHKGQDTNRKACRVAQHYGVRAPKHPTELVSAVQSGRPQSIGEDWASDLVNVVTALT